MNVHGGAKTASEHREPVIRRVEAAGWSRRKAAQAFGLGVRTAAEWLRRLRLEEETVGKAMCTLYGRPGVPAHSVCAIPGANGYVEVEVIAPSQKEIASMDAVGTLVQKANSRS